MKAIKRAVFSQHTLLAVLGGSMLALAAPPTDLYPAVLLSLLIFALLVHEAPSWRRGFGLGWLWGAAAQLIGMRFVPSVIELFTPLGSALAVVAHVLLSAAQSLHWACGAGLASWLHKRWRIPLEIAVASGAMVAMNLPSVFAWTPAGLISPWPVVVQTADLVGERGVSLLLLVAMTLLLRGGLAFRQHGWVRQTKAALLGSLAIFVALGSYGTWAMKRWTTSSTLDFANEPRITGSPAVTRAAPTCAPRRT